MRAVKAQASLCIGINSTEPSLLENAMTTKLPAFSSHLCEQRMLWQDCALGLLQACLSLHDSEMLKLLSAGRKLW